MGKTAILFIDLLGVQKMWSEEGQASVKRRIEEFNDFVVQQVNYLPGELHRDGNYTVILAGDSVSVMCEDYDQAIGIGIHLFVQAFYATDKIPSPFWLRGAIARWANQYLTVNTVPIRAKGIQIGTQYQNEDDYLAVLGLEKSGFRGMRLVVDRSLLPDYGRPCQRNWPGFKKPLGIVTRLNECTYPPGEEYGDVLWMTESEKQYNQLEGIMAARFKRSAKDPDEFVQASWTRVTFDHGGMSLTPVAPRRREANLGRAASAGDRLGSGMRGRESRRIRWPPGARWAYLRTLRQSRRATGVKAIPTFDQVNSLVWGCRN